MQDYYRYTLMYQFTYIQQIAKTSRFEVSSFSEYQFTYIQQIAKTVVVGLGYTSSISLPISNRLLKLCFVNRVENVRYQFTYIQQIAKTEILNKSPLAPYQFTYIQQIAKTLPDTEPSGR